MRDGICHDAVGCKAGKTGRVSAIDISKGMLKEARRRTASKAPRTIRFIEGDAIDVLERQKNVDLIFSSWVLGYFPLKVFWNVRHGRCHRTAAWLCRPQGQIPREPFKSLKSLWPPIPPSF